jgi:hypothetical protein
LEQENNLKSRAINVPPKTPPRARFFILRLPRFSIVLSLNKLLEQTRHLSSGITLPPGGYIKLL